MPSVPLPRLPFGPPPPGRLLRDELVRQRDILQQQEPVRLLIGVLAYGVCLIYLPATLIAALILVNLAGEIVLRGLMRDPDRLMEPARYRLHLLLVLLVESVFALPPAILWHQPEPYAKVLAVGMIAGSMMTAATVRAVHLPMGLATAVAIFTLALGSNTLFWLRDGNMTALAITSVTGAMSLGYFLASLLATNRLHRAAAAARAAAEAADAAKGRFLAQMSHELRTPLNAILGMGHALLRKTREDAARMQLSVLIASAEGLTTILDDILDLSAVQEGRVPIRARPASPADEIAATVALFRPHADEAGLTLRLDLAPDLPVAAQFDPQRLRQCLSNLLSNALKFTQSGGITVTARPEPGRDGGTMLRVEVSDTGPGIAAADRDALFQPFAQGESGRARQGNGLGLSISRALARQMGGDLVLIDAPGASFALTLALLPLAETAATTRTTTPTGRPPLAGLRALVVDDIATNRLVAEVHLRALGIATAQADSGRAALAQLADTLPDVVLLDMNMPDLDGAATVRLIRALPGPASRTPVIAMTADAMPAHRAIYLSQGLDGYLSKPLVQATLRDELQRVLEIARAG